MARPTIKIVSLEELLQNDRLCIPAYQRPYSWNEKQLLPLFEDLNKKNDATMIMGGIILHDEHGKLNIVDGQQRLVTFSIIHSLYTEATITKFNVSFIDNSSIKCIKKNVQMIIEFKEKRKKTVNLTNIHFVVVTTTSQEDAFTFFDSQNTRGKKLEPFDILKAHHLRYIKRDELATRCVQDWEQIEQDEDMGMELLLDTLLARGRKWTNKDHSLPDLQQEFKSQRTVKKDNNEYVLNRYQQAALFRAWQYDPVVDDKIRFILTSDNTDLVSEQRHVTSTDLKHLPLQICQTIEGGEVFFWYTQKYHQLAKELFSEENENTSPEFKEFYSELLAHNYNDGTKYTYEVYRCALLFYVDKFGYANFDAVATNLFYALYWLRAKQVSVYYRSIYKYIREIFNPFALINEASFTDYFIERCVDFLEDKYFELADGKAILHFSNRILKNRQWIILRDHPVFKTLNPS